MLGEDNMNDLHPSSQHFIKILEEMGALHIKKMKDYGRVGDPFANVKASEEWGAKPWIGAMIRGTDKIRRLQSYVRNGKLENEGVEDSLIDLAVYSVIALVLFREQEND